MNGICMLIDYATAFGSTAEVAQALAAAGPRVLLLWMLCRRDLAGLLVLRRLSVIATMLLQ